MILRKDLNLEALGKMALLPEDSSPLQVGTTGRYQARSFTLLGRILQQWSDGSWSELKDSYSKSLARNALKNTKSSEVRDSPV